MKASACAKLTRRPLTGHWFRALRLKHWTTRLSSSHSAISPSRFSSATPTKPRHRIVYLGENHQVAIHEVGALLGDPSAPVSNPKGSWAILSFEVILNQIVDLTDSTQQKIISTNTSELNGNWVNASGVSPTQELGDSLFGLLGLEGFLFNSSKVKAKGLAIFPEKLGSSSAVKLINEITMKTELLD